MPACPAAGDIHHILRINLCSSLVSITPCPETLSQFGFIAQASPRPAGICGGTWYTCICSCLRECVHLCMCMYVCRYACMYVGMHVCMYVCVYVCIFVYMYICIYVCVCVRVCGVYLCNYASPPPTPTVCEYTRYRLKQ